MAKSNRSSSKRLLRLLAVLALIAGLMIAALFLGPAALKEYARWKWSEFSDKHFARQIEKGFKAETIRITGLDGNFLETSKHEGREQFWIEGSTKFFVRVPGTGYRVKLTVDPVYRFHINLDEDWEFAIREGALAVVCPMVEPILPVAFDTSTMKAEFEGTILSFRQQEESIKELKETLSGKLETRAGSAEMIDSVRGQSRLRVAKFVRKFLLQEFGEQANGIEEIRIMFPDEKVAEWAELPVTLLVKDEAALE